MKTNTKIKTKPKFTLLDIFQTTIDVINYDGGYITKEKAINNNTQGTASKVYKTIINGSSPSKPDDSEFQKFINCHLYVALHNRKITNIDRKQNSIIMESLEEVNEIHIGTIVNAVYRFSTLSKLKEISTSVCEPDKTNYLSTSEGERDNFFVKITHKKIFANAVYFRWIDRNNSLGSFFLKLDEKSMKIELKNCIGISAVVRKKKINRYSGSFETILSNVVVLENYGSK